MNPKKAALVTIAILLAIGLPAAAVDVYINGVLVTGVRDQELDNVTVRLDAQGNVRITAPHYRVQRTDTTDSGPSGTKTKVTGTKTPAPVPNKGQPGKVHNKTPQPPPTGGGKGLTRQYWLVAQSNAPGRVGYRMAIHINGALVRSFDDSNLPSPINVSEYIRAGSNTVRVVATRTSTKTQGQSGRDWLRVVVADGHIEGTSVVIDHPGVIVTRNGGQTEAYSHDFTLQGQ